MIKNWHYRNVLHIITMANSLETMKKHILNDANIVMRFYSHNTYFWASEFYRQLCSIFLNLYFHLQNNYGLKLDIFA